MSKDYCGATMIDAANELILEDIVLVPMWFSGTPREESAIEICTDRYSGFFRADRMISASLFLIAISGWSLLYYQRGASDISVWVATLLATAIAFFHLWKVLACRLAKNDCVIINTCIGVHDESLLDGKHLEFKLLSKPNPLSLAVGGVIPDGFPSRKQIACACLSQGDKTFIIATRFCEPDLLETTVSSRLRSFGVDNLELKRVIVRARVRYR